METLTESVIFTLQYAGVRIATATYTTGTKTLVPGSYVFLIFFYFLHIVSWKVRCCERNI